MDKEDNSKSKDLSELHKVYKNTKNQLSRYDRLLDNHPSLTILPFFLALLSFVIGKFFGYSVWYSVAVLVLIAGVVLMIIIGIRQSAKLKLEAKLENLKDEARLFQNNNGSERYNHPNYQSNGGSDGNGSKVFGVIIAILIIASLAAYANNRANSSNGSQDLSKYLGPANQDSENASSQAACLNYAYESYQKAWGAADKDGDGSVAYKDGATDIDTSYDDAAISCYRTYETEDSASEISDYQAKRQQATDEYTAWLNSLRQTVQSTNNYPRSLSCTSETIGSTTYTNC